MLVFILFHNSVHRSFGINSETAAEIHSPAVSLFYLAFCLKKCTTLLIGRMSRSEKDF